DQVTDGTDKTGTGEVNISMSSSDIRALDFTLKAKYSMGASIDLEKAHGSMAPLHSDVVCKAA
ncbi:MAG: hypothetical protein ACTSPI_13065, partial [Candidatus Heimdallarchaeaceae archaeon]